MNFANADKVTIHSLIYVCCLALVDMGEYERVHNST